MSGKTFEIHLFRSKMRQDESQGFSRFFPNPDQRSKSFVQAEPLFRGLLSGWLRGRVRIESLHCQGDSPVRLSPDRRRTDEVYRHSADVASMGLRNQSFGDRFVEDGYVYRIS
jgi:hypothetical protein